MRLSDAILMGRNLVTACSAPSEGDEELGLGCGLTMAARAVGLSSHHEAIRHWPWLAGKVYWEVTARFDMEVMRGTLTLEEFVDYVRSIEPAEEAEKLPEPSVDDDYAEIARRDFEQRIYEQCEREDAAEIPEPTMDDGYEEEWWSDSDTARQKEQGLK